MSNGYGYESNQVRSLINLYRANPNLFDEEHLETLEHLASQQGMNFKPIKDTTTLSSLASNFAGGFVRGLVPLVPPDQQPRTTYEAIAQSLGHLAGFAPSILSLPLRGATHVAAKVAGVAGRKAYQKKLKDRLAGKAFKETGQKESPFIGATAVGFLDKVSLPMIGSRFIKGKMSRGITKLELDELEYLKAGGVGRAIAEEAVGLGTASVISEVWAGPDDYLNVFLGGALAGGAFGGIGNWRAIANRLGAAKTDIQRKGVESALKAAVGASVTGLPSTLRQDPFEMQLYEYLLGGFFGYQSRPAHEVAGSQFITRLPSDRSGIIFRPEQAPGFKADASGRGGLSKKSQDYVMEKATEQAEAWLSRNDKGRSFDGKWQDIISERLKNHPDRYNKDIIEGETRSLAENYHTRLLFQEQLAEAFGVKLSENKVDKFDFFTPEQFTSHRMAQDIYNDIKKSYDIQKEKGEPPSKFAEAFIGKDIEGLATELDALAKKHTQIQQSETQQGQLELLLEPEQASSGNVEGFLRDVRSTNYGNEYLQKNTKEKEQLLRRFFHQTKPMSDTWALDISNYDMKTGKGDAYIKKVRGGETINVGRFEDGILKNPITGLAGEQHFNIPLLDTISDGRSFKLLKYLKHGPVDYSELNDYNVFAKGNKFDLDVKAEMQLHRALEKESHYLYAGKKDKPLSIVAEFVDQIPQSLRSSYENRTLFTVKDIVKNLSSNNKDIYTKAHKESLDSFLKKFGNTKENKILHDRQFISNTIHLLRHFYPSRPNLRLDKINDIIKPEFFKNAVDFNKRMQLLAETSGSPLNENSFLDPKYSVVKNNRLNFLILEDKDINNSGVNTSSEVDGGLIANTKFFKGVSNSFGIKSLIDTLKPTVVGKLLNKEGIIAIKSNFKDAREEHPAIQDLMDRIKARDGSDIHFVVTTSANKVEGNTKPTKVVYLRGKAFKDEGKFVIPGGDIKADIHTIGLESFRLNQGTLDDAYKNYKGVNLPRQFLSTLSHGQMLEALKNPEGLKNIINYYTKNAFEGSETGRSLVKEYEKTNNIKPITDLIDKNFNNLDLLPFDFVAKKMLDPKSENNAFRRAVQKNTKNIDHQLESFEADTNQIWNMYHDSIGRLGDLANGSLAPNLFFEKISAPFTNSLRKHIMKRITTPFWEYGGKGTLSLNTKDIFRNADMIISSKEFLGSNEYVLLGLSHRKMKAKLDLDVKEIETLRKFLRKEITSEERSRGEKIPKIEDNGDTTLGTIWDLYKNAKNQIPTSTYKRLGDALDLLVIRVPSDSVSGTIPVKLGGFTRGRGTGILTTEKQDKYLGGADKDIDSAFVIQNGSKEHRKVVTHHKFDRERSDYKDWETNLYESLGATLPKDVNPASKFNVTKLATAHKTALIGDKTRGQIISMRDHYLDIIGRLQSGDRYIFTGTTAENPSKRKNKKIAGGLKERFELTLNKGNIKDFMDKVFAYINIANDSSKYTKIPTLEYAKNDLLDTAFTIRYKNFAGEVSKIGAADFSEKVARYSRGEYSWEGTKFSKGQNFFSEFKTNPFKRENKTLDKFLQLEENYKDQSDQFTAATGLQFQRLLESGAIESLRSFRNENYLKEFIENMKTSKEQYSTIQKNDSKIEIEKKKNEQNFLSKFLPKWTKILELQTVTPDEYWDMQWGRKKILGYKIQYKTPIQVLSENMSVNLNKGASYELLAERALNILKTAPKVKQKPNAQDKIIKKILQNASKKAEEILSKTVRSNKEPIYTFEGESNLLRSQYFDKVVKSYIETIYKNAKENNLSYQNLRDFFEISLLTPYHYKHKVGDLREFGGWKKDNFGIERKELGPKYTKDYNVYRQESLAWGSNEISQGSKARVVRKMAEIFNRSEVKPSKVKPFTLERITDTKSYADYISSIEKAQSTTEKIIDTVSNKKAKRGDSWNLDYLAFNNSDKKQITELRDNLLKHPQINDSFGEFFIDYTSRKQGSPRDLTRISMDDVRALNQYFNKDKAPKKGLMNWWNWLMDPRDIDSGALLQTWKKYETYLTDVKSLDKAGKPIILRKQKASTFMSPLGRMREYQRKMQVQQNAEVDPIKNQVIRDLDFKNWMTNEDKTILTRLLSNKRNTEEARLTDSKYGDFLNRNIKNQITKQTKTGQEWLDIYDKKVTEFYDKVAKEWLFTYDKKGERINYEDIDLNNRSWINESKGYVTDYIKYSPKTGRFDFENFRKKVIDPMETKGKVPKIGLESLLRYQWEVLLERDLAPELNKNISNAEAKELRTKRREDSVKWNKLNFVREYAFGFIKPEEYWSRTNYGADNAAKRRFEESVIALAERAAANAEPNLRQKAYDKVMAKYSLLREDSYHPSASLEKQFLSENYESPGYGSKPQNLLQRGKDFIDGYDVSPSVFENYKNQVVRSYFSNLVAIHGNRQINKLKYGKEVPDLNKVNSDLKKHNAFIEVEANNLYKKILDKKGSTKENALQHKQDFLKRHKYRDNADMWGDFLYIYLKNSLGHPSLLTDRIIKSMETADPLKLKNNPYYLTSDYAVTKGLERLYQSKKFNKMPFLRKAPKDDAARRDYFVRRLHDLGTMEARYNLLTLLANTGTMMTNLYGGAVTTMGSAGFNSWVDAQKNKKVVSKLLTDINGRYVLTLRNGDPVKTRKDLIKWIEDKGVIDSYIQNELDYNPELNKAITKLGKDAKTFVRDLKRSIKNNASDETILQLTKRYGINDAMLRWGGWFMQVSERKNRIDSFIAHALKAKERLGSEGIHSNLNDPFIFDTALKGIETTQFLYHSAFRPAFMTTALGKVLTRFKLFAFQSVRVRREFYKQAKLYGFKEGTDEYKKMKDLFLTDLFSFALGGAFMYSLFDTALPPPWDWVQDTADLMFGDKKERDRAFYGTLPRPIAPLQAALPPIARFPQTFVELVQGDWEKFSNYTVHTMYPGGRLIYSAKKTLERPETFWQNFFRIPVSKIGYRIDREQLREERREMIEEELEI